MADWFRAPTVVLGLLAVLLIPAGCSRLHDTVDCQRELRAEVEWDCLLDRSDIPSSPLDLEEIIEFALCRNLDLLVKAQEYAFHHETTTAAKLRMIPSLLFAGELSARDKNTGSFSYSLAPAVPPAPPSISSERDVKRYDIRFAWKLLDFGISYYRARQEAEHAFVRQVEYSRLQQVLVQDCTEAYWRAQVARVGLHKAYALLQEADQVLAVLADAEVLAETSADWRLAQMSEIYEAQTLLRGYEEDYQTALFDLAKLMGAPFAEIQLVEEPFDELKQFATDTESLAYLALEHRPELYGMDAQERVSLDEVKIAMVQLFPDLTLFGASYYDSNFFLIFNRWLSAGLHFTWDLLRGPQHIKEMFAGMEQVELAKLGRLNLSLGIITQVQLSTLAYEHAHSDYQLARQHSHARQQLLQSMQERAAVGEFTQAQLLISHKFDTFYAELAEYEAYGNAKAALANVNASVGISNYLESGEDI